MRDYPLSDCAASTAADPIADLGPDPASDSRALTRTNLFLAATMHAADGVHAVKIRDLSAAGARIESPLQPEIGDSMTLVRGRLRVDAQVSWCADHCCGLKFTTRVSVNEWMTHPVILERQRSGDRVAPASPDLPAGSRPHLDGALSSRAVEDLRRASGLLEGLGIALEGDAAVVARHGDELRNLAIAVRTLTGLAETIHAATLKPR